MSIINVKVISHSTVFEFNEAVKKFLNDNEEMVFHKQTVYGITQETRFDDEFGLVYGTMYSAIFQTEGRPI